MPRSVTSGSISATCDSKGCPMDLDDLRRALVVAGSRPVIDLGNARAQVGARAHHRRRRQRSIASGIVVGGGAVAVVVLVLAVAGGGPAREPVGVTVATGVTGPTNVVYERVPSRFD